MKFGSQKMFSDLLLYRVIIAACSQIQKVKTFLYNSINGKKELKITQYIGRIKATI